jgi:hypothetical protein
MSVAASRGITRVEDALPSAVKRAWERFFAWNKRFRGGKDAPYPPEVGWIIVGVAAFLAYSSVGRPFAEEILTGVRIRPNTMYVQEGPRDYDGPFRQSRGNRRDVHMFTTANLGSIYCVAGNPLPESALLRGDLAQEEYPQDPTKATVKRLDWTPNAIKLEVDAKEPTTILVNQNWAPQWRANIGTVKSVEKLLAVDVPGGKNVVELEYKDRFLGACLLVSLVTLLGVVFVLGRDGVRWAKRERTRWDTLPLWPGDPVPAAPATTTAEPVAAAPKDEESSSKADEPRASKASEAEEGDTPASDAPVATPEAAAGPTPSKPPPDEPT